jgi:hypothetical protein
MLSSKRVERFVERLFGAVVHAKRVLSISNATLGVSAAGNLAVHKIGEGLSNARGGDRKHCIKQVDRLLSNKKFDVWSLFELWVPYLIGARTLVRIAIDWTEFDHDDHSTLMLSMITGHGCATPLLWKTVKKLQLKGRRNGYERKCLRRLAKVLPKEIDVTIVADRGFGDHKLYRFLDKLGFGYIIRFRENIHVTDQYGEQRLASEWVPADGQPILLPSARVTCKGHRVPGVVCVKAKAMKDAWCLVVSDVTLGASDIVHLYGKRWGIETTFRNIKDPKFGMGMAHTHTKSTARRDRLFMLSALTIALLTTLGAAGYGLGLERTIKANTSKERTYTFFRQGQIYYKLLAKMAKDTAASLMQKFCELMEDQLEYREEFGII